MHPESLVLEYFLEPSTQYPKLPQPKSHAEDTDFTTTSINIFPPTDRIYTTIIPGLE